MGIDDEVALRWESEAVKRPRCVALGCPAVISVNSRFRPFCRRHGSVLPRDVRIAVERGDADAKKEAEAFFEAHHRRRIERLLTF